jgi:hypothetical protein
MTDPVPQLRDYIDGLTERLMQEPAAVAPIRPGGRSAYRGRSIVGVTAVAVALVAGVATFGVRRPGTGRSVATTSGGLFVPPVSVQGGKTRLPLVFPDGSTVDLIYPSRYNLARLGFQPEAAVDYSPYGTGPDRPDAASPQPCCGRRLTIKRGTIGEVMGGRAPTKVYRGAAGQDVPFFDSTVIDSVADLPQLAFQFGSWTVLAWDYAPGDPRGTRMTDEQRAVFASSLDGHEDDHGFLRLEPHAPLCLQTVLDGPNAELGTDGPDPRDVVRLYLQPLPHGSDPQWRQFSVLLPDQRFELVVSSALRRLRDNIQITSVTQGVAWRC